jgi:hypothetical protein
MQWLAIRRQPAQRAEPAPRATKGLELAARRALRRLETA